MIRTQVQLPDDLYRQVKRIAAEQETTLADVIRRGLEHMVRVYPPRRETPEEWRDHIRMTLGQVAPRRMTDGVVPDVAEWAQGYDPADWLDRAVMATRKATFPLHGIDPEW